jgi:hypothetical protein
MALRGALDARFTDCGLTLHPEKTKIVYCKRNRWVSQPPPVGQPDQGNRDGKQIADHRAAHKQEYGDLDAGQKIDWSVSLLSILVDDHWGA